MNRILLLPALALLFAGCRTVQPGSVPNAAITSVYSDPNLQQIHTLQDQRNTNKLLPYLGHANSGLRQRAALAFASVQDSAANPVLQNLLGDSEADVRAAAAYALGQTGGRTVQTALAEAMERESNISARAAMLEAYGKVTNKPGLELLVLVQETDTIIQNAQQWGIYRAGTRGVTSPASVELVMQRLQTAPAYQTRLAAAHTLARTPGLDLSAYERNLAPILQTERSAVIRAALASALSKMKSERQGFLLSSLATSDPDYRVRLAAIRSMSKAPYDQVKEAAWKAQTDVHPHVSVTAAEFLLANGKTEKAATYLQKAKEVTQWQARSLLLQAALRNASQKERQPIRAELQNRYDKSGNVYEKGYLLKALAEDTESFPLLSQVVLSPPDKVVGTYATEALLDLRQNARFPESLHALVADILKRTVSQGDVAQVGLIATALRDPKANLQRDFTDFAFLRTAQEKLTLPRDMETYIELQKTLDFIAGTPGKTAPKAAVANPINWQQVQTLAADQRVQLNTSKGQILLELLVNDAPGSATNFAELARTGFYDGKTFHRVVPNFVAQGGCPRGDGWGSTDYNIRSEFAPLQYQTGYVGLASAGKDTESCQWFITHSPAPHLDGRYTIFARVVHGMEVVHKLEIGDVIESVKVL